jgi:hypothetical protein
LNNYIILKKKTNELSKNEIRKICKLKNTEWKFGLRSNLNWFKKFTQRNDIHSLLFIKSNLVGYTLLRNRTFYLEKVKKKYFYFDTLIIKKKFRKIKLSKILMNFNKKIIIKSKKISFLICLNKMVKYYKKFGWKTLNKKKFTIKDHNFSSNGLCFNNKYFNKNKKYSFYLYK